MASRVIAGDIIFVLIGKKINCKFAITLRTESLVSKIVERRGFSRERETLAVIVWPEEALEAPLSVAPLSYPRREEL